VRKIGPYSPDFEKRNFKLPKNSQQVPAGSQKYRKILFFKK
jgi:hypothetical protein